MRRNSSDSAAGCGVIIIIFLMIAFFSGGSGLSGLFSKAFFGIALVGVLALLVLLAFIIFLAFKGAHDEAEEKEKASRANNVSAAAEAAHAADNAVLAKARRYVVEERLISTKLKSEEVRTATGRVLAIADKIISTLKDKPEKIPTSSQFLNYYLPTLGIILQKYKKVEASGVEIQSTREKVISYMGDIERAMQKEYENLFQSDILDLSVEMEAMTIACKRDGLLTDADLEKAYGEQTINLTL